MGAPSRPWWRNCALQAEPEIAAIDPMEDALGSLDPGLALVRSLISGYELGHYPAERWIDTRLVAIRPPSRREGPSWIPAHGR